MKSVIRPFVVAVAVFSAACANADSSFADGVQDILLQALRNKVTAKEVQLEPVPVTVRFRTAFMDSSQVAVVNTVTKAPLIAMVSWRGTTGGRIDRRQVLLDGQHDAQLGHMEGFPLRSGDKMLIESQDQKYKPVVITVP